MDPFLDKQQQAVQTIKQDLVTVASYKQASIEYAKKTTGSFLGSPSGLLSSFAAGAYSGASLGNKPHDVYGMIRLCEHLLK